MIPALDLNTAIAVVTAIVTVTALFLGQRYNTAKLSTKLSTMSSGQGELLRQVQAVHKRMDDFGRRLVQAEKNHAVLEERVANLRDTQRIRAIQQEVPLFKEDE